ncbi:MAG: hypothetical protein WCI41_00485 [bacterium]
MTNLILLNQLHGGYLILGALPIWAIVAIFGLIQAIVYVGRDQLEGLSYQTAYSAGIGDMFFVIPIIIGATILHEQRPGAIPGLFQESNSIMHIALLFACIALGIIVCIMTLEKRSGKFIDILHDVIIAPLFLFLAIIILPVIYRAGTTIEICATGFVILLWASLVVFDVKHDRMDQRKYLKEKFGIRLK